ncbi:hypothetical protein FQN57_003831 [Myotisia sp. PD_48]|nr:hypothetical protein FQN57_003831 [Myotisia sp. PD_48]
MAELHPVVGGNTAASMTPPASADGEKMHLHSIDSSVSDGGLHDTMSDIGDIRPDHYYGGGRVPVFKPTMDQFRDFQAFIHKIDDYGMKSGIVKVIPPKEWTDSLPALDEAIKSIRVKNPIVQEFNGSHGVFTQANIEKQRCYNLPQWKSVCGEVNHQPPARRGERRYTQRKPSRAAPRGQSARSDSQKRRPGPTKAKSRELDSPIEDFLDHHHVDDGSKPEGPPTPVSPESKPVDAKSEELSDGEPLPAAKPKGRQAKSVSSRRKQNRDETTSHIDDETYVNFDYHLSSNEEFTPERCEELETAYWKSLMYNNPMYGADMPGSLFDDSVTSWNVAKLPNVLDVLGQKVPGVNTAYLYLGMWKATFAWHLEDVDLYSINYIHFGAPKQWYSVSQEDLPRFETAMKSLWPAHAKSCSQFLRHKTYLVSPTILKSQFGININKLVHYEGEFVITYPYGYHSGFNLGYNCAESVNFATEKWLDYARVAQKCHCETDTVWIDVEEVERKLRGESTPEYYDERSDHYEGASDLLTPPRSVPEKTTRPRKRKPEGAESKPKRVKLQVNTPKEPPCILCPKDLDYEELLDTHDGQSQAHRTCAFYIDETSILRYESGKEVVCDIDQIPKARMGLKCLYCREIKGACFQCNFGKCARAYHATCALLAGVQIEVGKTAVIASDGQEYSVPAIDLKCKYHRQKKYGTPPATNADVDPKVIETAGKLNDGDLMQFQADREIHGAMVLSNRHSESLLIVKVLPKGDVIELPYRWLLIVKKTNFPPLAHNINPLPSHLERRPGTRNDLSSSIPYHGMPFFNDGDPTYTWDEFICSEPAHNPDSVATISLNQPNSLWYYLGEPSTDGRAQYTDDMASAVANPRSNFLDTVRSSRFSISSKGPGRPRIYRRDSSISTTRRPSLVLHNTSSSATPQPASPLIKMETHPVRNNECPAQNPPVKAESSMMARRLVASIVDHANATAGYSIVNSEFAVQALVGYDNAPFPAKGLEKLTTAMGESQVYTRSPDGSLALQPLNMEAEEVDHLIRMLRFAIYNLTAGTKNPQLQRQVTQEPIKPPQPEQLSSSSTGKWTYLEIQCRKAPTVYRSPYAPGFGFSDYAKEEFGLVGTPPPSRKEPLAADFFAKLSPEDQEKIVQACGHVPRAEPFPPILDSIEPGPPSLSTIGPHSTNVSTAMNSDNLHALSPFDMPLHADSPASSFSRVPMNYQSPQEFAAHIDHETSLHPRPLHDHHDLFGDQQANQRFWQRSVPWSDIDTQSHDGHRPFFGPHLRPAAHEYALSEMDLEKGPGSLHSMDMAAFGFDGPDDNTCPDRSP